MTYEDQFEFVLSGLEGGGQYQSKVITFPWLEEMHPELKEKLVEDGYFIDELIEERGKAYNLIKNYSPIEEYLLLAGWRRYNHIINGNIYWVKVRLRKNYFGWSNQLVSFFTQDKRDNYIYDVMDIWGSGRDYASAGEHEGREKERKSSTSMIIERLLVDRCRSKFEDLSELLMHDAIINPHPYNKVLTILFSQSK